MTLLTPDRAAQCLAEFCGDVLREKIQSVDRGFKVQVDEERWLAKGERLIYRKAARQLMVEMYRRADVAPSVAPAPRSKPSRISEPVPRRRSLKSRPNTASSRGRRRGSSSDSDSKRTRGLR